MANVAFLGTGLMGAALAEAAALRGDRVVAWNRTIAKAAALKTFGVRVVETPKEALVGAERIHIVLTDDAAVDAVLDGCVGALGTSVVIDHSTTSPAGTLARALSLESQGGCFLHAPLFMNPKVCRDAGGVMLCAGKRETFARVELQLRRMTGALHFLGERRDGAAAHKLFGNAMIMAIVAGLSDIYMMAGQLGIDPGEAHSLFSKFSAAGVIAGRGLAMAKGQYGASFELAMARKDVRLMLASAAPRELEFLRAISQRMDTLIERGLGSADLGVLAIDAVPPSPPAA